MTKARRCTLLAGIRIERGTRADWEALASLHYRSHAAGAVSDVFRMVHEATRNAERGMRNERRVSVRSAECGVRSERINGEKGEARERLVGVIVYARSPLALAARNLATGGRYRVGRGCSAGRLVNAELRIISRVVITPNWRGLGLARRLVADTMALVGTPYVEALAAMGRVHPFFEQAGMRAYPMPLPAAGERLRAGLEAAGVGRADRRSAEALEARLAGLEAGARRLAEREIRRWARSYLAAKNHRTHRPERRRMLELVSRHADSAPVYYLWRRPPTRAGERDGR
jgi:hypothetical protein